MKKLVYLLIVMCLVLTGCSNNQPKWDGVKYDSIEDMNTAAQTNLVHAEIEGLKDENYAVISKSIAEYKFAIGDEKWTIRASKNVDSDISGLYYDSIKFEKDVTAVYFTDDVYAYRFFYNDLQYVISLNVKGKDVQQMYFENICSDYQTKVTGVKWGSEVDITEDGNKVIYTITMFNEGKKLISEIIYTFENDKMVSITNNNIFETEQDANNYYDEMVKEGYDVEKLTLTGNVISSINTEVDFYSEYTQKEFVEMLKSAMN